MTTSRQHSLKLMIGYSLFLISLTGCGGGGGSSSSSSSGTTTPVVTNTKTISLNNMNSWSRFGNAVAESDPNGFILRNSGNAANFASAAYLYPNPLDNSVPYTLTLKVRGENGAQKLGITAPLVGENPNDVNSLAFSKVVDVSDGLDHTFTFSLPQNNRGIQQIALHFGATFGALALGNPPGSGILVEDVFLSTPLLATASTSPVSTAQQLAGSANKIADAGSPDSSASVTPTPAIKEVTGSASPKDYSSVADAFIKHHENLSGLGTATPDVHSVTEISKKTP